MADRPVDVNRDPFSSSSSEESVNSTLEKRRSTRSVHEKILLVFSACVLLFVAVFIAVLVLKSVRGAEQRAICREVEAKEESGETEGLTNTKPSVQDIFMCHNLKCSFDVLQCKNVCPFSYELDEIDCPTSCDCAGSGIMQGDIQFDETDVRILLEDFGYTDEKQDFTPKARRAPLWRRSHGKQTEPLTITYSLDEDLTDEQISSWKRAVDQLKEETCIRFKEYGNDTMDYLLVTKTESPDCKSYIGRKGGRQKIVMGECFSPQHVEHMLMHTLGFGHEHTRYDRDAYIQVNLKNVMKKHRRKFRKSRKGRRREYSTEFDKESVTMFHGYSYSIEEGQKPTILDLDTKQALILRNRKDFSELDIQDINELYCKDIEPSNEADATQIQTRSRSGGGFLGDPRFRGQSWSKWGRWGHCDETCGKAIRRRYRTCRSKSGKKLSSRWCPGKGVVSLPCKVIPCPHDVDLKPRWKAWGEFGKCSKTCGAGIMYRFRQCSDGKSDGGDCRGRAIEGKKCNTLRCSYNQNNRFDPWSEWSECSATCGGGRMTRFRECKSESRKRARFCGGKVDNDGMEYQTKVCFIERCQSVPRNFDSFFDSRISKAREEPAWFVRSRNQISASVCEPGGDSSWMVGDFNGDGKNDVLCRNNDAKIRIVLTDHANRLRDVSWEGEFEMCLKDRLFSGDFDGDGTADVLCVAVDGTDTSMLIFLIRNGEPEEGIRVGRFCVEDHWSVYIVDTNGDGKDDILCRDKTVEPNKFSKIHVNVMEA